MQDKDIVEVYSAANEAEAYLIKNLLDNIGIQARVANESLYGIAGAVPYGVTIEPRVWVTRADSERALGIIEQWETEQQTRESNCSLRSWVCPNCDQKVPGNFDVCWKCQYSRTPASG